MSSLQRATTTLAPQRTRTHLVVSWLGGWMRSFQIHGLSRCSVVQRRQIRAEKVLRCANRIRKRLENSTRHPSNGTSSDSQSSTNPPESEHLVFTKATTSDTQVSSILKKNVLGRCHPVPYDRHEMLHNAATMSSIPKPRLTRGWLCNAHEPWCCSRKALISNH